MRLDETEKTWRIRPRSTTRYGRIFTATRGEMSEQPESWLRGTHGEMPAVVRAVVHALELCRENVETWCAPLSDDELHARPADVAPVAFHLRHIVRSLDRLLTYAEGRQLDADQLAALRTEMEPGTAQDALLREFREGIEDALRRVRGFAGADLEEPRSVGRKELPTTVGGLLVHCADHTQRHTGQAVTTAKVVGGVRMNQIHVIAPYRHLGMWVFDDANVGLVQEPFVGGADTIIDAMVTRVPNAAGGFAMVFSAGSFPGYQFRFERRRPEASGTIYYSPDFRAEGWLCPALLRYFESAPEELFVQVKPLPKR